MGYLTPVLIYNDSISGMKNDPTFIGRLYDACIKSNDSDVFYKAFRRTWFDKVLKKFGLSRIRKNTEMWQGSGDCAQVLKPMHADCYRVLVISGNTLTDITEVLYSKKEPNDYEKSCINIVKQVSKDFQKK